VTTVRYIIYILSVAFSLMFTGLKWLEWYCNHPPSTTSVKGPKHSKLNCAVYLCKKTARKTELSVLWHSTGFPSGLSGFFLSVLRVFLCVWLWWIKTSLSFAVC